MVGAVPLRPSHLYQIENGRFGERLRPAGSERRLAAHSEKSAGRRLRHARRVRSPQTRGPISLGRISSPPLSAPTSVPTASFRPFVPLRLLALSAASLLAVALMAAPVTTPVQLPAGNWTLRPQFTGPLPTGTVTAIDVHGTRVTAPLAAQIHFHFAEQVRALEWSHAPLDCARERAEPFWAETQLAHSQAPLPLADATARERIVLQLHHGKRKITTPTLPLLPRGARVAVVTSWDDGHPNDLRAAELLRTHGFAGTFFLNERTHARRHHLSALVALGMEIGSHTVNHPRGWQITPEQWAAECLQMRLSLEASLGHAVVSFAYPYNHTPAYDATGDYVLRGVRAAGYWSGRTTRIAGETITGYAEPLSFSTDGHFLMSDEKLEQAWRRATRQAGGVFYFWGHTSEIRTEEDWQKLAARLARYAARKDAWYATQGQVFLWRWLRTAAQWEHSPARDGVTEIVLTFPRLDPHWRQQLPLTLDLPSGVARVTHDGRELPIVDGRVTIPAS